MEVNPDLAFRDYISNVSVSVFVFVMLTVYFDKGNL